MKRMPISKVSRRVAFQLSCTNHSVDLEIVPVWTIRSACEYELKTPIRAFA
jgi:hypothetical protein